MSMKRALFVALSLSLAGCAGNQASRSTAAAAPNQEAMNKLTAEEQAAGWRLLFDGQSTTGWRGFKRDAFPANGWVVEEGLLKRKPTKGEPKPGDIITVDQFDNFELSLEWRLTPAGNSGVKYLIDESLVKDGHGGLGFEMQILDDDKHPDAKKGKDGNRTAGALYDLIPPRAKAARPVGEWNVARLVVNGNHVEHWLNGVKVVEFERGSPELKALIAESKYKVNPGFGDPARGHILLQDHNDEVAYRNIKVRPLPTVNAAR
jgi:hypothetical protein